jgi:hypothetical protein
MALPLIVAFEIPFITILKQPSIPCYILPKQPFKHPIILSQEQPSNSLHCQTNLISIMTKSIKFIPLRYLFELHIIIRYIFLVPQGLFQTFA